MFFRLLRGAISILLIAASILVAAPMAGLGLMGLVGRSADTSRSENIRIGLVFLWAAALIWALTLAWYVALNRQSIRWQFGVRTLLIATTLLAVLLGLAVWATSK
jgi:hypothetical protein